MDELAKQNKDLIKSDLKEVLKQNTQPAIFKNVRDLPAAISSDHESLASLRKVHGDKLPIAIIQVWIVNLNDFLNINRKMNETQINETSQMIYDEFYYLKTSDLALIFQRIKTGFYGQFYESIDGMKILDIFYKYAQERVNHFVDSGLREHEELKGQSFRK